MRYGFVIDQDRCIGCHACTVACKEEHEVPIGVFRTWVKYIEKGEFPDTRRHFGVMRCNHCDSAPCIEICPTKALFRRPDGIVDFDNRRCIGCKSCMQACPYDALYIDPNTNTAAKCNFCAHRVEAKLEPACVIVCPTQAIIAGDLDNPASKISRMVATEKVSVRKPHKGTEPKLFYKGIEGDLLEPTRLSRQNTYVFADQRDRRGSEKDFDPRRTREVYDVAHPAPWGWKIAAYLWTKSIAAGVPLVAALAMFFDSDVGGRIWQVWTPLVALVALAVTAILLIYDLKRPERFFYLLTKPNFRSWLVIGAYILLLYGALLLGWLWFGEAKQSVSSAIVVATAILAVPCACYSALLFRQAKGRDLWQSAIFFWHLLLDALIAGSASLFLLGVLTDEYPSNMRPLFFILWFSLSVGLLLVLLETAIPHGSEDSRRSIQNMITGRLSVRFWLLAVIAGMLCPVMLGFWFVLGQVEDMVALIFPILALLGVWASEDVWVRAGQSVPLS